jgi:SAM-dependent methyltransferase
MISQSSRAEGRLPAVGAGCGGVPGRPPWRRLKLIGTFSREILNVWRTYGAKPALSQTKDILLSPLHWRLDRQFDRRHGLETAGSASLALLSVLDERFDRQHDKRRYEAVPLVTFARMMSRLPADLSDYVFVDFGSGKGRALLLAARYGFKRIIGIEFAAELHGIAKQNVEKCAPDTRIELINQNAVCYPIPDEKCVFYFFHPFGDQVLAEIMSNIEESYHRRPRKMFFLYVNPHGAHVIHSRTFVHLRERRRFGLKTGVIYETADPA